MYATDLPLLALEPRLLLFALRFAMARIPFDLVPPYRIALAFLHNGRHSPLHPHPQHPRLLHYPFHQPPKRHLYARLRDRLPRPLPAPSHRLHSPRGPTLHGLSNVDIRVTSPTLLIDENALPPTHAIGWVLGTEASKRATATHRAHTITLPGVRTLPALADAHPDAAPRPQMPLLCRARPGPTRAARGGAPLPALRPVYPAFLAGQRLCRPSAGGWVSGDGGCGGGQVRGV